MVNLKDILGGEVFDADEVPDDDYGLVPEGEYTAMIVDSEIRDTRSGTGKYIALQFELVDNPTHNGRRVFTNLNIVNENPKTVEIAYRQLGAICKAVGVVKVDDTTELHDKPMRIKVTIAPPRGDYGESNQIKGFKPLPSSPTAVPPKPQSPQAQAQPTTAAPKAKKPWEQ